MERTIDGIDYIAKSEVLKIIDENMEQSLALSNLYPNNKRFSHGWKCRYWALKDLRESFADTEER